MGGGADIPAVSTDDTGWRIGGAAAFPMGFSTPLLAVPEIRRRHRHQEVVEILSACFTGLLGTDRGSSDEAEPWTLLSSGNA